MLGRQTVQTTSVSCYKNMRIKHAQHVQSCLRSHLIIHTSNCNWTSCWFGLPCAFFNVCAWTCISVCTIIVWDKCGKVARVIFPLSLLFIAICTSSFQLTCSSYCIFGSKINAICRNCQFKVMCWGLHDLSRVNTFPARNDYRCSWITLFTGA